MINVLEKLVWKWLLSLKGLMHDQWQSPRFTHAAGLYLRMPVETRSLRDRSAVGRFPTVTLGFGEDTEEEPEEPEENGAEGDNACLRWLRKVCPCCCPRPDDDDITDTLVTGIDDLDKGEETNGEKPATDDSELDGNKQSSFCAIYQRKWIQPHDALHSPVFASCRTAPESAIDRPDEKQIRGEPHRAPHESLPKWWLHYSQGPDVPHVDHPVSTFQPPHWQTAPWT